MVINGSSSFAALYHVTIILEQLQQQLLFVVIWKSDASSICPAK